MEKIMEHGKFNGKCGYVEFCSHDDQFCFWLPDFSCRMMVDGCPFRLTKVIEASAVPRHTVSLIEWARGGDLNSKLQDFWHKAKRYCRIWISNTRA